MVELASRFPIGRTPRVLAALIVGALCVTSSIAQIQLTQTSDPPALGSPVGYAPLALDKLGPGIVGVHQLEMRSTGTKLYGVLMTIRRTGRTDTDLLSGTLNFNGASPVFTADASVNGLNTVGSSEANVSANSARNIVVFERSGSIRWAKLSGGVFTDQGLVTGIPAGATSPKFTTYNGSLSMIYVSGLNAYWGTFNTATGFVTLQDPQPLISYPKTATLSQPGGAVSVPVLGIHSVEPMHESGGNVLSFLLCAWVGLGVRTSIPIFASGIHNVSEAKIFDTDHVATPFQWSFSGWLNGGTVIGTSANGGNSGTLIFAYAPPGQTYGAPVSLESCATSCQVINPGILAVGRVAIYVPFRTADSFLTGLFLGNLSGSPITLPGFQGTLGLAGPVVSAGTIAIPPSGGSATYLLTVPLGVPPGFVFTQGVAINLTNPLEVLLTNNSVIKIP